MGKANKTTMKWLEVKAKGAMRKMDATVVEGEMREEEEKEEEREGEEEKKEEKEMRVMILIWGYMPLCKEQQKRRFKRLE